LIGTIATNLSYATEDGLIGVAVDRVFQNRIFVVYSHSASGCTGGGCTTNTSIDGAYRLSVFPMDPVTHMITIASEQVVLEVPSFRNRWHTAGALNFDNAGNLYWDVGDNETAFTGPGNTRSLRGSILRIHPNAGVGGGYTIPSGNLWQVAAATFAAQGLNGLATKYRDTALSGGMIRPEIYVKGVRNTYVAQVNPYNGILTYSQCGPDNQGQSAGATSQSEAWNLLGSARFAGWPFWVGTDSVNYQQVGTSQYGKNGSNEPAEGTNTLTVGDWSYYLPGAGTGVTFQNGRTAGIYPNWTVGQIVNTWRHDTIAAATVEGFGIDSLPPYVVQSNAVTHGAADAGCAMGATLWYYDGRVANPNKFPPQMNNVWFNGSYSNTLLYGSKIELDSNSMGVTGKILGNSAPILAGYDKAKTPAGIGALVDLQEGPDGALYVVNYGCNGGNTSSGTAVNSDGCTGVGRIEFKTTSPSVCADPNLTPNGYRTEVASAIEQQTPFVHGDVYWLSVGSQSFTIGATGPHEIRIMDSQGRVVTSINGQDAKTYSIPSNLRNGIYYLQVKTELGTAVHGFARL
jgi:glucose/arabinose dehydrogenase